MFFAHRIFRCGAGDYYGDEILHSTRTHTAVRLKAIADAGFSGIWLHGILRDLSPTELFAAHVRRSRERLAALSDLCRRARRFKLGVWLYLCEPMGLPEDHPFWRAHPDLKGHLTPLDPMDGHQVTGPGVRHLCSSTPAVRRFLREGFRRLFCAADLAGVFLISASEHPHHCWSHACINPHHPCPDPFWVKRPGCPRCAHRHPADVVAEIINTVHEGVTSTRPQAKVVAWDWDWNMYEKPPYRKIIAGLNHNVVLMGDFERGTVVRRAGTRRVVEEYSLMAPGPSPRFKTKTHWVRSGRTVWAKLQINTTHELATVPNLPLPVSLYRKFKYLRQAGIDGYMATWNFGCATDTLNAFAVKTFSNARRLPNEPTALKNLARDYFGPGVDAKKIVNGWYAFQRACRFFPHGGKHLLYFTPINYALAYPLKRRFDGRALGPSWRRHEFGDRLEDRTQPYTFSQLVKLLEQLSAAWTRAVDDYEEALAGANRIDRARKELGVARAVAGSYRSLYNVYRWYQAIKLWTEDPTSPANRAILTDELENLRQVLPWVKADPRLGFHEEPHWSVFNPRQLKRKLYELTKLSRECGF